MELNHWLFLAMTGEKLEMEEDGGFQTTKVGIYIYNCYIYIYEYNNSKHNKNSTNYI